VMLGPMVGCGHFEDVSYAEKSLLGVSVRDDLENGEVFQDAVHHIFLRKTFQLQNEVDHIFTHRTPV